MTYAFSFASIGYTSLMIKERFKTIAPVPIRIEASSPKSRDIYAHYGFEVWCLPLCGILIKLTSPFVKD